MELLIPLFSCKSLHETLDFYAALGFEVTHQQEQPYLYGAVNRGEVHLHFAARVEIGVCLVMVPDVRIYHRTFADALRTKYGKVPTAGLPCITRLREGQTRFQLSDPAGNSLLYINNDEPDPNYDAYTENLSPLARALEKAVFLRDTYADDESAAKMLDRALARHRSANSLDRALALAARAELAVALGDTARLQVVRDELKQIPISEEDRDRYRVELEAADDLEQWLIQEQDTSGEQL